MDFNLSTELPRPPGAIWPVLLDVGRIAACIPGCEQVEELSALAHYKAVMKQKLGPFKLDVPAEIFVDEVSPQRCVRAHAKGRDKLTGTTFTVRFSVTLLSAGGGGSTLTVDAALTVAGKLASLGYGVIKKRAEENFAEFNARLKAEVS
jgi:hypothetical protein